MLFSSWSAHISHFLSTDLQFRAQSSFFVLPFGYTPLWFFFLYLRNMNLRISIQLVCFGLHITCKYLTMQHQETLRPPQTIRNDNWNYLLRRLVLFQTKFSGILLIFFRHLSEVKMQIEHTHTHTNDTTAERNISCWVYSFETCVFYLVSYSMFQYVEVILALHVFCVNCPVIPFVHIFIVVCIFLARSQN